MSSLDTTSKMRVLKQLAKTQGEKVTRALEKEAHRIGNVFKTDARFDILYQHIGLLDVFAFRIPDIAIDLCEQLLDRLDRLKLAQPNGDERGSRYETSERLTTAVLDLLVRIRLFRIRKVLGLVVRAYTHGTEEVRKKAGEGFERISGFNIDTFYSGENRAGLGPAPQFEVIGWLESLDRRSLKEDFDAAVALCTNLLSPNMTGTSWDYKSVTWSSTAVPATTQIIELRQRALGLLKKLYADAHKIRDKQSLINAMMASSRMPDRQEGSVEIARMISDNTVDVMTFLEYRLPQESLQIVQKIEHDVYWRFYHAPTDAVRSAALKIRDLLKSQSEYIIYRDLVGFNGIFRRWEDGSQVTTDFAAIEEYRAGKAKEYAYTIDDSNWAAWRARIISFCQTESDDLATFPKFYSFLEHFADHRPDLAFLLVQENLDEARPFIIPLLRGLWRSARRPELLDLFEQWIRDGVNLYAISKLFWSNKDLDEGVLVNLLGRFILDDNRAGLGLIIGTATSNYADRQDLLNTLVLPAIVALTALEDARWINEIWYSPEARKMFSDMDEHGRQTVLAGLLYLHRVDYHAEEILIPFAQRDPISVMNFFRERMRFQELRQSEDMYEAVPYGFHQLNGTLNQYPDAVVDAVYSWFDEKDYLFQFRGGRLLQAIFPEFPEPFAETLARIIQHGNRRDFAFVTSVLRTYDGQSFLYEIVKDIIASIPDGDAELLEEISAVVASNGVVSGEYGYVTAYLEKAEALRMWLDDPREKVRLFADRFIQDLKRASESERRRADESIALRKHAYGERNHEDGET
ncbi:hypothetical protein ACU8MP_29490 (plasmid) [Rhizobium leguminosarum]